MSETERWIAEYAASVNRWQIFREDGIGCVAVVPGGLFTDSPDDCETTAERHAKLLASAPDLATQVSALTEQRDAAVAACKAGHKWMFDEATIHPDAPAMQLIIDQFAAAIAMTEGAK